MDIVRILKGYFITEQVEITDDMIQKIANNAIREAQRKSLENGIPNVYSKNGVLYFQLPDGTITMDNPFEKGELKEHDWMLWRNSMMHLKQ